MPLRASLAEGGKKEIMKLSYQEINRNEKVLNRGERDDGQATGKYG